MAHEGAGHALVIAGEDTETSSILESGGDGHSAIKAGARGGPSGQATIRPGIGRQLLDQFNHLEALPG